MENTKTETEQTEGLKPPPWVDVAKSELQHTGERISLLFLSDAVRWLMKARQLEFVPAVKDLHHALEGCEGLTLYLKGSSGLARPVGDSDTFLPRVQQRTFSKGIGGGYLVQTIQQSLPNGIKPGKQAALHFLLSYWGKGFNQALVMDSPDVQGNHLAISCEQAAALWGAKPVPSLATQKSTFPLADIEALVAYRKASKGKPWDAGNQLELARAEVEKQGGSAKAYEAVAERLGIPRQSLQSILTRKRMRKPPPMGEVSPSDRQLMKGDAG